MPDSFHCDEPNSCLQLSKVKPLSQLIPETFNTRAILEGLPWAPKVAKDTLDASAATHPNCVTPPGREQVGDMSMRPNI